MLAVVASPATYEDRDLQRVSHFSVSSLYSLFRMSQEEKRRFTRSELRAARPSPAPHTLGEGNTCRLIGTLE